MVRFFAPPRRVCGVLWTVALPATALLAGLGAAFLLAPAVDVTDGGGERMRSREVLFPDGPRTLVQSVRAPDSPLHPRVLWVRRFAAGTEGEPPGVWSSGPVDGLHFERIGWPRLAGEPPIVLSAATIGVGWLAVWAAGLCLLWGGWAAWTGRLARLPAEDEPPPGGGAVGRRWRRAGRPWLVGLAAVGGLCLASPVPLPGGRTLLAEARRDPDAFCHPRLLWVAWERPHDVPTTAPPDPYAGWAAAEPLAGARRWGLRAERAGRGSPAASPARDLTMADRTRWAAEIGAGWLVLPVILCSAVSLRRSRPTLRGPAA